MKTIAFYSYKGGMGKSLAAANLAVCLSRLGKTSALLELDFNGPSQHNKFYGAQHAPGKGGFIEYFLSNVSNAEQLMWPIKQKFPLSFERRKNLEDVSETIPSSLSQYKGLKGYIHLIPAGNPYRADYWERALSPLCHRLFRVHTEFEKGRINKKSLKSSENYFLQIKEEIKELQPNPDYLIVDLGSGAHELSSTVIQMWADVVACMFSYNDDNISYISNIISQMQSLEGDNVNYFEKIIPVLCRVSTSMEIKHDRKIKKLIRKFGDHSSSFQQNGRKPFYYLHADRDLEMDERLYLGYDEEPKNSRLSHDYVKLFAALLKSEDIPKDGIAKEIGLPSDIHEEDRIFRLETDRGALINPNDGSRNVSFKVETFQLLISGLEEAILETPDLGDTDKTKLNYFENILKNAGEKCGSKFGESLNSMWKSEIYDQDETYLGEEAYIRKWCNFDSDVGFGRFLLYRNTFGTDKNREGYIILRESFLTPADDVNIERINEHVYCEFITGYIKGVLNQILEAEVKVKHLCEKEISEQINEDNIFHWENPKSESCVFHFKKMS